MTNIDGQEFLDISSDKYCEAAVTNVEAIFGKAWFKVYIKVC